MVNLADNVLLKTVTKKASLKNNSKLFGVISDDLLMSPKILPPETEMLKQYSNSYQINLWYLFK